MPDLRDLVDRITSGAATEHEVLAELEVHLHAAKWAFARKKLSEAIDWAKIYFSPRKWEKWGSRNRVMHFLVADITKAHGYLADTAEAS